MPPRTPSLLFNTLCHCHKALLRRSRRYTTISAPNPPVPSHTAFAQLPTRRLISLRGHDASHFLQGLITQNIPSQYASSCFYSAFLNASGRVLHDVYIYPDAKAEKEEPGFLIEVDSNEVEALARHLKRYKLRAKVGIRVIDEGELSVWATWGKQSPCGFDSRTGCLDQRAPDMGRRVIVPGDRKLEASGTQVGSGSYDIRRMMMGVAEGQGEILKESALPQESNIDYMGGINFRKGCYVGQELTIRTHHTGVVRKRILPVQIYPAEGDSKPPDGLTYTEDTKIVLPPKGANISRVDKKGRSAGKWLGGVGNIGLALCRLEIMTDTVLTGEGSQWSPEHEFKMAWEPEEGKERGEVRVKAFVPNWHQSRAESQKLHRS
ncbi:MAG: ccr4 associated factor [Alectoria fallacina]|uniref:Iron-sulfur cluster assembly factor IBA57 homolog, mitochondrial n=1 Tax=Alectoria fallacina TaxID=1903189 RepID=A0A8H3I5Q4_9LECA|nr:MAG: ccr4 associated factor [Alectoria fallacina]